MTNTKTLRMPSRLIVSAAFLMLFSAASYLMQSQTVYAAACVSTGQTDNKLAIGDI